MAEVGMQISKSYVDREAVQMSGPHTEEAWRPNWVNTVEENISVSSKCASCCQQGHL